MESCHVSSSSGLSGLGMHTQEIIRQRRETGKVDVVELVNVVRDVVYHLALPRISVQIPGVWSPR
ncbi:MAG: hypothetical protein ACK5LN_13790 [Propioniciclava sp.]